MSLESIVYTRLSTDAAVTALIGTRIYPQRTGNAVPDGVSYATISRVPGFVQRSFDGLEWEDAALEVECFAFGADAPEQVEGIAAAVRKSLEGYSSGGAGPGAWDSEYDTETGEEDAAARTVAFLFPVNGSAILA